MPQDAITNREVFSVTDINKTARRLLEGEFPMVFVEGEISNFTRPSSGHWYLTLKDEKAQLRCAMFVNRNRLIRFTPKNGMQVIVRGRISLYEGRGEFQLIAEHMEEAGDGALRRAFEQLKVKLDQEGLFSQEQKQAIPALPGHIGVITSPTGAAIRDVLHVLARRFPAIPVTVLPVAVQGEESVAQIVAAIELATRYDQHPIDVILLTRGGGSLEDLWSFNTEPVARAIFTSKIPIVCGVGHETDITIADFVADLRAPTPSAAAEYASPDQAEWLQSFERVDRALNNSIATRIRLQTNHLAQVSRRLRHPGTRLTDLHQRLDDLELRLRRTFRHFISGFRIEDSQARLVRAMKQGLERNDARIRLAGSRLTSPAAQVRAARVQLDHTLGRLKSVLYNELKYKAQNLVAIEQNLTAYSPAAVLDRGYAIIMKQGKVLRDARQVSPGEEIIARLKHGEITANVTGIDSSAGVGGDSDVKGKED